MARAEAVEKVRQEIMRFRELLDVFRARLDAGERDYAQLFADVSPEDKASLPEKELQRKAAYGVLEDRSPLSKAVLTMRFQARELEREFEQLYDIIMTDDPEDE
jgi:hypothetical protein